MEASFIATTSVPDQARRTVNELDSSIGLARVQFDHALHMAMRLAVTAAPTADGLYRCADDRASVVPDIFDYEIIEALRRSSCPLCAVEAIDDRRWMDSFWREGKQDARTRRRFYAAGGFCRHHAWLLHRLVAAEGAGAAIADVYGSLADRDLARLDELRASLGRGRRRRSLLRRGGRCPACVECGERTERKVHFFVELLGEPEARRCYRSSDGLCFAHLGPAAEHAVVVGHPDVARFLLDDWRERLGDVRHHLAEFDRKRDHRFADEPRGEEQRAWTQVIRRYVGEPVTAGNDRT